MNISRTALSRRSFLGASLISAVAAGSATLLTACGNDGSSDGDKLILKFGVNNPKVTFDTQKTGFHWRLRGCGRILAQAESGHQGS